MPRKAGHSDHSSKLLPLCTIFIQACLEINVDELCRQQLWLWNEAALTVKACAPKAFIATKRVPKHAKKPPDQRENKPRKLI
jgi:hypothetical protein